MLWGRKPQPRGSVGLGPTFRSVTRREAWADPSALWFQMCAAANKKLDILLESNALGWPVGCGDNKLKMLECFNMPRDEEVAFLGRCIGAGRASSARYKFSIKHICLFYFVGL